MNTPTSRDAQRRARQARPPRRRISIALAIGFSVIVAFEIALTLGAPFGAAALGGAHAGSLPAELRIVTAVNGLFWVLAALVVLARGGVRVSLIPRALARVGTWALVGLLALGALMNIASFSPWERFGWAPFTLILFVLTLLLARGGVAAGPAGKTELPS